MKDHYPRRRYHPLHWRLNRLVLFLSIVGRESAADCRLDWRTAWDVSSIVWSKADER